MGHSENQLIQVDGVLPSKSNEWKVWWKELEYLLFVADAFTCKSNS
jgi:hypothetical protein